LSHRYKEKESLRCHNPLDWTVLAPTRDSLTDARGTAFENKFRSHYSTEPPNTMRLPDVFSLLSAVDNRIPHRLTSLLIFVTDLTLAVRAVIRTNVHRSDQISSTKRIHLTRPTPSACTGVFKYILNDSESIFPG